MKSENRLGLYIERLDRPNTDLRYGISDVCGITNVKQLVVGTKANLIGRTFEKFSILAPKEFIFNRRTSRNGERISLGYNTTDREWILTEDYCHFRVRADKLNELDPDFLYLFFLDPEFDRYARFNSWGSATEFFNWEEMQNVPIKVPPMEVQKKAIKECNIISTRIQLLRDESQKLKELALTFYYEYASESSVSLRRFPGIKEISSGISIFDGQKAYWATGDIDEDNTQDEISMITYTERPSRANMQPTLNSIWFAKMQNTKKVLYFTENDENLSKVILSTGFMGLQCIPDNVYYVLAFIYSDYFEQQKNQCATGTTQIAINSSALDKIEIRQPKDEVKNVNTLLRPLFEEINLINNEISALSRMRKVLISLYTA